MHVESELERDQHFRHFSYFTECNSFIVFFDNNFKKEEMELKNQEYIKQIVTISIWNNVYWPNKNKNLDIRNSFYIYSFTGRQNLLMLNIAFPQETN